MKGYNKAQRKGQMYGPYIGPVTVNEVDGSTLWQSYEIEPTTTSGKKKKKASRKSGIKKLFYEKMRDLEGNKPEENATLETSHEEKEENYSQGQSEGE